jgi:excisionase family DNA binding protein
VTPSGKRERAVSPVTGEQPHHESRSECTVPTDPPAFTVREAAQRVGCSRDTIRRMVKSGELPAFRHGPRGKIFIARDEIEGLFHTRSV